MAGRRVGGGILTLLDLIEEHRDALAYDWRTRFHLSLSAVPDEMGWDEALSLVRVLRRDASSHTAAAMEKWDQPYDGAELVLMRQYELTQAAAGVKNPKPFPTAPWAKAAKRQTQQVGDTKGRTRDEVVAHLRRLGHKVA